MTVDDPVELDRSLLPGLRRQRWAYRTANFQALGFDFAIRTTDTALGRYLDDVLGAMAVPGQATEPAHVYSFVCTPERSIVVLNDEPVSHVRAIGPALGHLLWDVNRRAVASMPEHLLLHASAVARDGAALVFPASMNSGKTTLAAGLVRAGLDYITDEAVAFNPHSLQITPYAKPLAIESGSWDVLPDLRPNPQEDRLPGLHRRTWHVPPDAVRPSSLAGTSLPGFVIFPKYQHGARTRLTSVARPEAVRLMAIESFNVHRLGRTGLATLVEIARRSDTYRLSVGSLADACDLILPLVD